MTPAPGPLGKSLTGHLRRHSSVEWVGLGGDSGGTVLGAADLSSIQAGVMQAQQQRHETLQHQLPQGASKPHSEPAPSPPHQGPQEPDCRGADWVPSLRARMQSGGARRERLSGGKLPGGAIWGQERDLVGSLGRGACPGGAGPGAERQCSRRPAVAGGVAPVLCSEAAPAPAAAAGASSARPARRPRAAHRVRPGRPGERAAARSRAAPAEAGILGRRSHPGPVLPGPAPHLPSVQREVAKAKQA